MRPMSDMHAAGLHPATDEPLGAGDHPGEALGPLDLGAWGAGVLGVAIGLVMTFCFILATA